MVAKSEIPDSVNAALVEVRDELAWLVSEFEQLVETTELSEFTDVLDGVLEYVEDLHSALEGLEKVANKGGAK